MLSNDQKAKQEATRTKKKSLEETCHVSSDLATPKMFEAVVNILPRQSPSRMQLNSSPTLELNSLNTKNEESVDKQDDSKE
ncbi:hypothetical protein AB6A40_002711 [Gnathostoma spinigerum]|uniref:Uncharacterized protein n=1 Tax=Gnathostoma spinigerum TaxID=75299 RepID=A0ABD6E9L7_9BILA